MEDKQEKPSYLDENLEDGEHRSGHTRLPLPEREGEGTGKERDEPAYPERPDEFGDGDRRS